jgi:hypothetical protein
MVISVRSTSQSSGCYKKEEESNGKWHFYVYFDNFLILQYYNLFFHLFNFFRIIYSDDKDLRPNRGRKGEELADGGRWRAAVAGTAPSLGLLWAPGNGVLEGGDEPGRGQAVVVDQLAQRPEASVRRDEHLRANKKQIKFNKQNIYI